MKKGTIYILFIAFALVVSACSGKLQLYDLSQDYSKSLHFEGTEDVDKSADVEEKSDLAGVLARNFYGGDLKRGGIWFAGKDLELEKGDEFIFDATNIGPDSIPFGSTFPPIDLVTEKVILKITARAEYKEGEPTLYLQLEDADGYKANAKMPFHKIENSADYKDYFFDLKDVFVQVYPKKHSVNGAMINSLRFYINPGQSGFTGMIYIKEIKVVLVGG